MAVSIAGTGSSFIPAGQVPSGSIDYSEIQNISATDKVLGRSSSGAGVVEEIACTSTGRSIIACSSVAAVKTALSLTIGTDVQAYSANLAAVAAVTVTAAGTALLDDADAAAQRTTLGLGTLATQSGTFSGTSSGTNTGDQTNISGNAATVTNGVYTTDTGSVTNTMLAGSIALSKLAATPLANIKVGSFTFDLSSTTGSTSVINTLTFTPKAVIFIAGVNGTSASSIGLDDGTTVGANADDNVDSAATYADSTTSSIVLAKGAGASQVGKITTLASDGFTVTWTKSGSPTGTATITYLVIG